MNEAKFSASYKVMSPKGYEVMVTVRTDDPNTEQDKLLTDTEAYLDIGGYTPINRWTGKPIEKTPVPARLQNAAVGVGQAIAAQSDYGPCPKCGSPLVEKETKTGKKMLKCSTQKWDFMTKTATGCDYVKWLDDGQASGENNVPGHTGAGASPAQKTIILEKWPDEWFDGMTKAQASAVISRNLGK